MTVEIPVDDPRGEAYLSRGCVAEIWASGGGLSDLALTMERVR